jgi:hypothetical protein
MNVKHMTEHEGLFLTAHATNLNEDDESIPSTWEIVMQYELYEERPDREKFLIELFDRSVKKNFRCPYKIEGGGDAAVTLPDDLVKHAGKDLAAKLKPVAEIALKNYAGLLFMRGQGV